MTKEELEKATGQELIDERDYCGVDGYYSEYLKDKSAEMLKRFNRLVELEKQIEKMKNCFNCAKGDWNNRTNCLESGCVNKNKWELKEK